MHQKAKGNSFERRTAELVSLLLTDNKETRAVWRTHSSGAMHTKNVGIDKKYCGDLYRITDKGIYKKLDDFFDKYVIECKHYDDLSFKPPFRKVFYTNIIVPTWKEKGNNKVLLVIGGGGKSPVYFVEDDLGDWDIVLKFYMGEYGMDDITIYGYEEKKINKIVEKICL